MIIYPAQLLLCRFSFALYLQEEVVEWCLEGEEQEVKSDRKRGNGRRGERKRKKREGSRRKKGGRRQEEEEGW